MSGISKKKETELYNVVHEEIMQLRINIAVKNDSIITTKELDNLLSQLCISAPQKAIDVFKK
jgi:hypothetical protein